MQSLQSGFSKATLAAVILGLVLSGCRSGDDSATITRSDGQTYTTSTGGALLCVFSLGFLCPARGTDLNAGIRLAETSNTPHGVAALAASGGIAEIHVSWRAAIGADREIGYRVYRDGNAVADTYEPAYTDSLLDTNRSYCYRVAAIDESLNLSAPSAPACATTSWQIATVEADIRDARPAIAIDALEQVHIAYVGSGAGGAREIAYANRLSGSWRSETVGREDGVFTDAPAIVIDALGSVHIGTLDRYTTNVFGSWQSKSFEAHNFAAMALDSSGFVHLVSAGRNGGLNHATNAGGGWVAEPVGRGSWQQSVLAIDALDGLHVVAYDYAERELVYVNNTGGSWVSEVIAHDFPPVWHLALAIDAQRGLHLSYQSKPPADSGSGFEPAGGNGLGYASNSSGSWQFGRVDTGNGVGAGSSIAVDAQDHVHISYTDRQRGELRYASNASGDWKVLTIASGDAVDSVCELADELCGVTAIAIDRQGKAHIGYHDSDRILYISNR